MMDKKLFIQIPAYNEEADIQEVIRDIPKEVPGIDAITVVVIDDGSIDDTVEIARRCGITHVIDLRKHSGLGVAFRKGLEYALANGADIIVNIDADRQYKADDIGRIITPILKGETDLAIGNRQLRSIPGYPLQKRISQAIGNYLVSKILRCEAKDVTSGFRAINKNAAEVLVNTLTNDYTYTLESLCMLLTREMRVTFVPVTVRYPTRNSRLIRNKMYYCMNFIVTLCRFLCKPYSTR